MGHFKICINILSRDLSLSLPIWVILRVISYFLGVSSGKIFRPDFKISKKFKIFFSSSESTITSTHHQDLTFTLTLERSDSTFNYPEQQWSFISNYAVTDYSGDYKISLIPCTAGPEQKFSDPPKCKFLGLGLFFRKIDFFGFFESSEFSEKKCFFFCKKSIFLAIKYTIKC